jgi:hypothetical protein
LEKTQGNFVWNTHYAKDNATGEYKPVIIGNLARLGFSDRWIELGIIRLDELDQLKKEYGEKIDKDKGHFRWGVYERYKIKMRAEPESVDMEAIYRLGESDPDQGVGGAIMTSVLWRDDCPLWLLEEATHSEWGHVSRTAVRLLAIRNL